ncbi:MAG: permease prefix domain 1-containing protein, partial [Acidobacteriaceae bacterium]
MTPRPWLRSLLRNLLHKQQVDQRLDAEVRAYADLLTDERIAAGMSPEEARRTALRDCGGIEQITHGTFNVKPGSLFPALHRMEEAGWLASDWGESENNRRARFY